MLGGMANKSRVLLAAGLILAVALPLMAKDPKKPDPVQRNHRHLKAILSIVKKNKKQTK